MAAPAAAATAKKRKKDEKAEKLERRKGQQEPELPPGLFLVLRVATVFLVFGLGYGLSESGALHSEVEGKMSIWARFVFFVAAQSLASEFFAVVMLQAARSLLREDGRSGFEPTAEEMAVHDSTISWPDRDLLSEELKGFAHKPGQPFSLNHVTGKRRFKDACMRFGMTIGSLLAVWFTSAFLDKRPVSSLGLALSGPFFLDMVLGCLVGVSIVVFMFAVELSAGWLHFLQFFEVFDRRESFSACILWDVIFHLNVSLNEELPVRGWMLFNIAEAMGKHLGLLGTQAFVAGMVVESLFFVVMHLASPGGSKLQSILNIFIGGMSGGLNVLLTGGLLGFSLGWHFGWNITMGNVLGLSTSGIPISATFVSVAPHPEKQHLHGGVFGPEGGVVSPVAYLLGVLLLALLYGWPGGDAALPG